MIRRTHLLSAAGLLTAVLAPVPSEAQVDYRNADSGRPTRIADATPTERRSLEISLTSARLEKLTLGRYRLQLEPRLAYGILPRTEISLRAPIFFYERALSPRAGVGGIGLGGEHQVHMESLAFPAVAFASEMFVPTGPNAIKTSFSGKILITRTLSRFRAHLNGGVSSFSVRIPDALEPIIPPIHGPCAVSPIEGFAIRTTCTAPTRAARAAVAQSHGEVETHAAWTTGIAIDRTFPLSSFMIIGDVYRQKYTGIGREADWTAELGARKQVSRSFVVDGAMGRLFTGESRAWFLTFGTTFTRAGTL